MTKDKITHVIAGSIISGVLFGFIFKESNPLYNSLEIFSNQPEYLYNIQGAIIFGLIIFSLSIIALNIKKSNQKKLNEINNDSIDEISEMNLDENLFNDEEIYLIEVAHYKTSSMKKISGGISFLSSIVGLIILNMVYIDNHSGFRFEEYLIFILCCISAMSILFFTTFSKFWKDNPTELQTTLFSRTLVSVFNSFSVFL